MSLVSVGEFEILPSYSLAADEAVALKKFGKVLKQSEKVK